MQVATMRFKCIFILFLSASKTSFIHTQRNDTLNQCAIY